MGLDMIKKHKTTKEIFELIFENYKLKFKGPISILHELKNKGEISKYEYKKALKYTKDNFPYISPHTENIHLFDVVPNSIWYETIISKLK